MYDLSVIIVSWNTKHLLLDCLRSLQIHLQHINYEILVVDNASTDGSANAVASDYPTIRVIRNDVNLGFGTANNQAIRQAAGRYLLLLNPDTRIIDDTLSQMVEFLDHHPEVGATGCRILDGDGRLDPRCGRREPTLLTEFFHETGLEHKFSHSPFFGQYLMTDWDHHSNREVEVLSGACFMVRRSAVDEVGLLDEAFFMYGEDIDWCTRLLAAGWRVYFYAQGAIVHLGDASANQVRQEMNLEKLRSRYYYFEKHRGALYAYAYRLLLVVSSLSKCTLYVFRILNASDSRTRQRHQAKIDHHRKVLQWTLSV